MNRRILIFTAVAALALVPLSAQEAATETLYRESDIGIDYRAIAEPPLDVMLSHGEVEFYENATLVFGDETAEAWREMSAEIGTGAVSRFTVLDMREFTPNMLIGFSDIELSHTKYGRLSSLGSLFISERFLLEISE